MNTILWKIVRSLLKGKRRREFDSRHHTAIARRQVGACGDGLKVNGPSQFNARCEFGNNCNFNGMVVKGCGTLKIGSNFHSGERCRVITSNHNFDHGAEIPYDSTNVAKSITIEDNVWLGDSVIIVGNVRIGEGAIIGAGAVVCTDVPAGAIFGGNPARLIRYRDMDHYRELKQAGRFH